MPDLVDPPIRIEDLIPASASMRDGGRFGIRHMSALASLAVNRVLTSLPPLRVFYRRLLQRELAWSEHDVVLPRLGRGLDGLRVAYITDLHAGSFLETRAVDHVLERVREQAPDVVCFGGDLINSRSSELQHFDRAMAQLDAPLGLFAVRGNHDLFETVDTDEWQRFFEERGVQVLVNEGRRLSRNGDSFWLGGVDDLEEGCPDLEATLAGQREDEAILLLSHHPDLFVVAARLGVDLTLSGHTHGGQIKLGGKAWITHSHQGFSEGWYRINSGRLYVSRGVGASVLPLRLDCPPELAMFTLRCTPRD